jgi:protein phosphatase
MAVRLNIGKCSLLGNYRENNEDAVEVKEFPDMVGCRLEACIVADGMGGQAAGEKASQMATEVIPRELQEQIQAAKSADDIRKAVRRAVVQANEEIMAMGQLDRDFRNMGTTVVMALWVPDFRDDCLFIAGVGDSRGYLVRDGKIEQLTTDHSLAQALVEAKTISPEEAREHRFKNVLWKYLGSREVGEGPEVKTLFVRPGDQVLLCTDGLTGVVPDERLQEAMLEQSDPQECAAALCQLALDSGSRDNVSCIVINVDEGQ